MKYHHIILEPQLFHTVDFIVYCESKEQALNKVKMWTVAQVEKTRKLFEGKSDQLYFVRAETSRWNTGWQNRVYMGVRVTKMLRPDVFIV